MVEAHLTHGAVSTEPKPLSVGFVLELDNIRNAARWRADAMLEQLVAQVGRLSNRLAQPAQLVVVYDTHALAEAEVQAFLARHEIGKHAFFDLRVFAKDGLGYYAQKNFGITQIDRELVFLIDSDITLDDDWFARLSEAFEDPAVNVAFGDVSLETGTFFEKAFALMTHSFPVGEARQGVEEVDTFLANNVALRRAAFDGGFFPSSEAYRGHCKVASDRICAAGGHIYRVNDAKGRHPAPNGLRHFLLRALVDGHDEVILTRLGARQRWKATALGSVARLARSLAGAASRTVAKGRRVGLHPLQVVPALGVAIAYYGLRFVGEIATQINPRLIRDNGVH